MEEDGREEKETNVGGSFSLLKNWIEIHFGLWLRPYQSPWAFVSKHADILEIQEKLEQIWVGSPAKATWISSLMRTTKAMEGWTRETENWADIGKGEDVFQFDRYTSAWTFALSWAKEAKNKKRNGCLLERLRRDLIIWSVANRARQKIRRKLVSKFL